MRGRDGLEPLGDLVDQLRRRERPRASVLAQDPGRELLQVGVRRAEDVLLDLAAADGALDPPGGVRVELDLGLALHVAELPALAAAERGRVEIVGRAEVALAAGGEPDVSAHARNPECAQVVAVEVEPDQVPGALLRQKRVRVDRALGLGVSRDRPVAELDRALLRDRVLELRQPPGHLDRVVGVDQLDAYGALGRRLVLAGPAERQVLKREPQRLGVGELPFEQVERRLERGQLVLLQLQLGEEVLLGAQGVELLAGELVALRMERHPEGDQLGAIGVEAAREGLVRHLRVALDIRLHVPRGDRPALRHEKGDERELADELVGVV